MPRYVDFQLQYMETPVLNVGVGGNPAGVGGVGIVHLDLDRWRYPRFVQGDAHHLPFRNDSFKSVLCGDVLEHIVNPVMAIREMVRVAPKIILTTFQEWRLPGVGQHIEAGQRLFAPCDEAIKPYGSLFVERYPEDKISHIPHINQWAEGQLCEIFELAGASVLLEERDCPGVHDGHLMLNYLFVLVRA